MSNQIIDKKTGRHSFGSFPTQVHTLTTISLVLMPSGGFGLSYEIAFGGLLNRKVNGGPYQVDRDLNLTINEDPLVILNTSNYNQTPDTISMNVSVSLQISMLGKQYIFSQTLGGEYSTTPIWTSITSDLEKSLNEK